MTTGSTVLGTVQGMAHGLGGGGVSGADIGKIINVVGTPNNVISSDIAFQIAWDGQNEQAYQLLTIGSTWVKIGSTA